MDDREEKLAKLLSRLKDEVEPRPEHRRELRQRMLEAYEAAGLDDRCAEFERLIARSKIDVAPRPKHREQLRRQMLETFEKTQRQQKRHPLRARVAVWVARIPTRRVTALVAASIVLAAAGLFLWNTSDPILASTSFADVVAQVRKAKTVCYTQIVEIGDEPPLTWRVTYEGSDRRRMEPTGAEMKKVTTISDWRIGKRVYLKPSEKKALVVDTPKFRPRVGFVERLTQLSDDAGRFVETRRISGRLVNVFRITTDTQDMTLLADPQTNLPLHLEIEKQPGREAGKPTPQTKWTLTDFVWNAELDPSLLSIDPPPGYRRVKDWLKGIRGRLGEHDTMRMLQVMADMPADQRPKTIDKASALEWRNKLTGKRYSVALRPGKQDDMKLSLSVSPGDPTPEGRARSRKRLSILRGLLYVNILYKKRKDWHFSPDGFDARDKDTPICWWKADEPGMYHTVYGDFEIRTIRREDLPTDPPQPATQPK